jgi:hypothetical protein
VLLREKIHPSLCILELRVSKWIYLRFSYSKHRTQTNTRICVIRTGSKPFMQYRMRNECSKISLLACRKSKHVLDKCFRTELETKIRWALMIDKIWSCTIPRGIVTVISVIWARCVFTEDSSLIYLGNFGDTGNLVSHVLRITHRWNGCCWLAEARDENNMAAMQSWHVFRPECCCSPSGSGTPATPSCSTVSWLHLFISKMAASHVAQGSGQECGSSSGFLQDNCTVQCKGHHLLCTSVWG